MTNPVRPTAPGSVLASEEIDRICDQLRREQPEAWPARALPAAEIALLAEGASGDPARLRRMLKRRLYGDPMAYVLGHIDFAGRRFAIDRRAFVTDPETEHLVWTVRDWAQAQGGRLRAAEVGIGAGALGITLLKQLPSLELTGLELDDGAAALCRENARTHGVRLEVLESDLFQSWGDRLPPDIIYGDLPWGDGETLYDGDRDLRHYLQMPPTTAFALSDRTGTHRDLLAEVRALGWTAEIFLNCGTLPDAEIAAVAAVAGPASWRILRPAETAKILHLTPGP